MTFWLCLFFSVSYWKDVFGGLILTFHPCQLRTVLTEFGVPDSSERRWVQIIFQTIYQSISIRVFMSHSSVWNLTSGGNASLSSLFSLPYSKGPTLDPKPSMWLDTQLSGFIINKHFFASVSFDLFGLIPRLDSLFHIINKNCIYCLYKAKFSTIIMS